MALTVKIRGDATHLEKTLRGVKSGVGGLASGLAKFTAAGAGFAAMMAGINSVEAVVTKLGSFLADSSTKAAGVEALTMQFETLLGSASAAKDRMEEIKEFAASTPFEVANLSATSKLLQTLGGTMLATGEGLRMVGDAASIAGQPIEEIGLHIGRIFGALTSGTSAGESIARMQELGLMTGETKREFEALAEAQKKGDKAALSSNEALKLLKETFKSTDGAMAKLAATMQGKMSNLQDNIDNLKVAFGTGMNEGLKVALDAVNAGMPKLEERFTAMGDTLGKTIGDAVEGNYDIFFAIGTVIGNAIKFGAEDVIGNLLFDTVRSAYIGLAKMGPVGGKLLTESELNKEADAVLGRQASLADRSMLFSANMRPSLEGLSQTITRRDIERQTEVMQNVLKAIESLPGTGIMGVSKEQMKETLFSR